MPRKRKSDLNNAASRNARQKRQKKAQMRMIQMQELSQHRRLLQTLQENRTLDQINAIYSMLDICRTCLTKKDEMLWIFNQGKSLAICDMIMAISSVEFLPNDPLPPQICMSCFEALQIAYYFKEQVIRCNNALQKAAETLQLSAQVKEEEIEENADIYKEEQNDCVDSEEERHTENFVNVIESFNDDLSEDHPSNINVINPHCEQTLMRPEEIKVEEHGVQSDDNSEEPIPQQQIMIKNEPDVHEFCPEDDLFVTCPSVTTEDCDTSEDIQQSLNEDGYTNNTDNTAGNTTKEQVDKINSESHNKKLTRRELKLLKCDVCERSFAFASTLKVHMRSHTNERPFKCLYCDSEFTTTFNLNQHTRKHTGEALPTPYKCEVCEKSFPWASYLRKHMKIHTKERPYKCQYCSKGFAGSAVLKLHIRVHTGEASIKPHKCEVCGKAFRMPSYLRSHMRSHTHEKPFKCLYCDTMFTQKCSQKRHIRQCAMAMADPNSGDMKFEEKGLTDSTD